MNQQLIKDILLSLRELRKETHTLLEEQSGKYYISITHLFILDTIRNTPKISLQQLAKRVNLSPSSTSEAVEKMVKLGYVSREQSETNRRAIELMLTELGLETLKETYENWIQDFSLFDAIGEEKLTSFYNTQQEMIELLKERREQNGANKTK
ncbi:MarR family transcriptional regulator [Vagococcus sp. DIV0080]|uniref:MarR family transcriptional regulator n=1 Tax=Candidatus Vagococcus giribetii TaxID=2230876 RepID=A0ABS3HVP2_9ENTE|nr:MarR family transcriptional regulator [Vagococcus sp. DIV0080]MBO0477746.1 MarR family transcriptional regulator [Vagococcus sp. DIV0080]